MLYFPTLAERCYTEWLDTPKTISLVSLALSRGADRTNSNARPLEIKLTFDDDTSLLITGRGRSHKVEVFLP